MDPTWLNGGNGYFATVTGFFENKIEGRSGDQRLSASLEFESSVEVENVKARFGCMHGRWKGQLWDSIGTVHLYVSVVPITCAQDIADGGATQVESHARYRTTYPLET